MTVDFPLHSNNRTLITHSVTQDYTVRDTPCHTHPRLLLERCPHRSITLYTYKPNQITHQSAGYNPEKNANHIRLQQQPKSTKYNASKVK